MQNCKPDKMCDECTHLPMEVARVWARYASRVGNGDTPRPMTDGTYDPFNDRLSRDLRNTLAGCLSAALDRHEPRIFRDIIQCWRGVVTSTGCLDYLEQRSASYETLWRKICDRKVTDPLARAVMAWNAELFFECHDLLEALWQPSHGERRKALQAFIQAAGVYIHLSAGNENASRRLARKARQGLIRFGHVLNEIGGLGKLIEELDREGSRPPQLYPSNGEKS